MKSDVWECGNGRPQRQDEKPLVMWRHRKAISSYSFYETFILNVSRETF